MISALMTAFRFALVVMIFSGLVYPLLLTGLGQAFFSVEANGSLLRRPDGQLLGSSLLGQSFATPQYFHPRPAVNNYDAANSGGSNLGATSKKLVDRIVADSQTYQKTNQGEGPIPIDAVTASSSNLDPHISLANAMAQAPRVAEARGSSVEEVKRLVATLSENSFLSESPYVNVLKLNLALGQRK